MTPAEPHNPPALGPNSITPGELDTPSPQKNNYPWLEQAVGGNKEPGSRLQQLKFAMYYMEFFILVQVTCRLA